MASGTDSFQSDLGTSRKKPKSGLDCWYFVQKSSSCTPNISTSSRLFPPKKKWPPMSKMHSAQSDRNSTGYLHLTLFGFLRDKRYIVGTREIFTGRTFPNFRAVACKFWQMWLSNLDLPHFAILASSGSDIPGQAVVDGFDFWNCQTTWWGKGISKHVFFLIVCWHLDKASHLFAWGGCGQPLLVVPHDKLIQP